MRVLLTCVFLLGLAGLAWATPSTTYWTPCVIDIQAPGTPHLGIDNYFTVGKKGPGNGGEAFPTDLGLTWGFKLSDKLMGEAGFDMLEPTDDPLFFNAKIGVAEGALSKGAPAVALGLFNVGTKRDVTNQNIFHLMVGKTIPGVGRLTVSGYVGNRKVLKSSRGDTQATGWMAAWDKWIKPGKIMLAADYASGKNAIGGGGAGVYFFFNKDTSLLVGPVWFNDEGINGKMKWTTQMDVNF